MLCNQIFGKKPQQLSKFYGTYYHALTTHLSEVNRMIAPSSLYTESEERIFSSIRGIVRSTSSRSMESIRDVGIVRYECRYIFKEHVRQCSCVRVYRMQKIKLKEETSLYVLSIVFLLGFRLKSNFRSQIKDLEIQLNQK